MTDSTFITRVILKNYKSIAACDVQLHPLMFLVGPNGAGKSNFLDALRFVAEALRTSLDHALRDRGGLHEVRHRSNGHPTHFEIRLDFTLEGSGTGHYAFRIGGSARGGYEVQDEECVLPAQKEPSRKAYFRVKHGKVTTSMKPAPAAAPDRLYLVNASGWSEFHWVYESLSRMGFYHLNPEAIRALQPSDLGGLLARDGGNLTSVFANQAPWAKERIREYLAEMTPGLCGVEVVKALGVMQTLEFCQHVADSGKTSRFLARNMSDGTLRALGILVALFQSNVERSDIPSIGDESPYPDRSGSRYARDLPRVPLVGIEEPELALHPAAAGVLLDSLLEASSNTQILVTSHSPDLLDDKTIETESILAVESEGGMTRIGPLNDAGRSVLQDRLYTAGELLRINQLTPHPEAIVKSKAKPLRLFNKGHTG